MSKTLGVLACSNTVFDKLWKSLKIFSNLMKLLSVFQTIKFILNAYLLSVLTTDTILGGWGELSK